MATFGSFILFFVGYIVFYSYDYVKASESMLEFGSWHGKRYCDMTNIDYIESLKQYRFEGIVLHLVRLLKRFVPKDIEWIFTDYNKYPNTGRK